MMLTNYVSGTRFGILQFKIAIISMLSAFTFSVCEKTTIPLKHSRRSVTYCPAGDLFLKVERRVK